MEIHLTRHSSVESIAMALGRQGRVLLGSDLFLVLCLGVFPTARDKGAFILSGVERLGLTCCRG